MCGIEILLLPDVKEMDRAINMHVESHAMDEKDPERAKAVFEQIQDHLVAKVLAAASRKEGSESDSEQRKKQQETNGQRREA